MKKKLFNDQIRAPLPKLNSKRSLDCLSKSPKTNIALTERKTFDPSDFGFSLEKVYNLERKLEDLNYEFNKTKKKKKEIEIENQNLKEEFVKFQTNEESTSQATEKKIFFDKSNISENSLPKAQGNEYSGANCNLKIENDKLRNKIHVMENMIKDLKFNSQKSSQEFQVEYLKWHKKIEELEKDLELKE